VSEPPRLLQDLVEVDEAEIRLRGRHAPLGDGRCGFGAGCSPGLIPVRWWVPAFHLCLEPRMSAHKNARTTPLGRAVMVRRVEMEGWTAKPGSCPVA